MRSIVPRLIPVLVPVLPLFASELYEVTVIGPVGTEALAINNQGVVTGRLTSAGVQAFRWTRYSGLQQIGGLAGHDINDSGQIVGRFGYLTPGVWERGKWVILEGRQGGSGINDAGHVAGLISAQPSIPGPYAPYRDDNIYKPGFHTLERPYDRASHGNGINNHDLVIADCGTGPEVRGVLYVPVVYAADLSYTIMDYAGNHTTHPLAINDLGQVAGYTRIRNGDDVSAVQWGGPEESLQYLGTLGPGGSIARAINNLGAIVGRADGRAFLWRSGIGMQDLNTRIDPTLSIHLEEAWGINDEGEIVVRGHDQLDQARSFLLTPFSNSIRTFAKPYMAFCSGDDKLVSIKLKVPPGTSAVGVEEELPCEWTQVIEVSHGGAYDAAHHQVKWGPFIAPDMPTDLYYRVAVPHDYLHAAFFSGVVSLDGTPSYIAGDHYLVPAACPHMAADATVTDCGACADCTCARCADNRIQLCEVVGYACQWHHGCHDDMSGVTRAAYVWLNGEFYCWDMESTMWDPVLDDVDDCGCCSASNIDPGPQGDPSPYGSLDIRWLDGKRGELRAAEVALHVGPVGATSAAACELAVPQGWRVVAIDDSGYWDPVHRKIKWGPFLGHIPDRLTCHVAPGLQNLRAHSRADFAADFRAVAALDGRMFQLVQPD